MRAVHGPADLLGHRSIVAFADDEIEVRPVPKTEADAAIKAGHYSRSVAWASSVHLGVFRGADMIGALQFGPPMNPRAGSRVVTGTGPDEWLELNRMWLAPGRPDNCASRAISAALRWVRILKPAVTWIQSFADSRCGKFGAVYQACSFDYLGSHTTRFYLLDGEWFHKSMVGRAPVDKRGWGTGPKMARLAAGIDRAEAFDFEQHRYVKFLDRRVRKRLVLPTLPYPKVHALVCDMDGDCTCTPEAA